MTDHAIRQENLAWGRVRNRRTVVHLPPPIVIRGLQARKKAAPVSRPVYARAALIAGLAFACGTSPAYALMLGNKEMRA